MKKTWKKLLAACCALSMLMTVPGVKVLADQIQGDEVIVIDAKDPEQLVEPVEEVQEDVIDKNADIASNEDVRSETHEPADSVDMTQVITEEVVGEGDFVVGDGVTATFDEETGAVEFYSDGGTLWADWTYKAGIARGDIESIRVASGTVYLPTDSGGLNSDWDYQLFGGLDNLIDLDLSGFNTSKVIYMSYMFYGCSSLTNLDLSGFDTSNVTEMSYMFRGCSSLTNLDLSSFDTSNAEYYNNIFDDCKQLRRLLTPKKNSLSINLPIAMLDESGAIYSKLPILSKSIILTRDNDNIYVGDGVTATFDEETGTVELYSNGGTLWTDWIDKAGIGRNSVEAIKVASGTVYLPEDSRGHSIDDDFYITYQMFGDCENLQYFDFNGFDTSKVIDMSYMFEECSSLTELDFSGLDTSKVTDMRAMFVGCSSLEKLNLSGIDTSNVTDMRNMFQDCSRLSELNLSGFNTSNVTDMVGVFYNCRNLEKLDLSDFNTSKVTDMSSMFYNCGNLMSLDLSNFNTSGVMCYDNYFTKCYELESLKTPKVNNCDIKLPVPMLDEQGNEYAVLPTLSDSITLMRKDSDGAILVGDHVTAIIDKDTGTLKLYSDGGTLWRKWTTDAGIDRDSIRSIRVESGTVFLPSDSLQSVDYWDHQLFGGLSNLTDFDTTGFNTSRMTDMADMFEGCYSLLELDVSGFDTSNVTNMASMFSGCNSLKELDVSGFDTSNVTNMSYMFSSSSLANLDLSNFDTSNVTDMSGMFNSCSSLTNLDLSSFDTSNVTEMWGMFNECQNITNMNLSSFDTSNVTGMYSMFDGCSSLAILDISGFDVSNVTNMGYMFHGCNSLKNLDLSGFDTSSATGMSSMFSDCSNLTNLDVSGFKTSNVKDMSHMFRGCNSLEKLDFSSFDTSNVINMSSMFDGCRGLKDLDLSSFDTSNVTEMWGMFSDCQNLTNLNLSSFETSNVEYYDNFFESCELLSVLKTPKENSLSIELPVTMYDEAGNEYYELPILSKSITLTTDDSGSATIYNMSDCVVNLGTQSYTYDGKEKKPDVTVKHGTTTLLQGTDYSVIYTNNTNAGTATVKVTGIGNYKGEQSVTFTIDKADPKLTFASSSVNKTTLDAAFTNKLTKTTDGTVTFKSSNSKVATVASTSGKVTIKGEGTATITATAAEGTNYKSGSAKYTLTVVDGRTDVSGLTVSLSATGYTYDGKAKEPTVTVKNGSTALISGTDYTVSYADNTNAGTATAKVTGIGKYKGEQSVTFTIEKADPKLTFASSSVNKTTLDAAFTNKLTKTTDGTVTFKSSNTKVATVASTSGKVTIKGEGTATIAATAAEGTNYKSGSAKYTLTVVDGRTDVSGLTVSLSATSYTYDGKAKEPTVTVKNGSTALISGTDYTVSYADNTNAGTATAKVTGAGNYKGEKTVTFTISKANAKLAFADSALTKKTTDAAFTNTLTKTTDGSVTFKSSNTKVATVNSTSGLVTIKGAGKATITATAAEGKNYKAGSATYSLTVEAPAPTPTPAVKGFSDVQDPNHAFYKAIYWAADAGITKGYPDGTFGIDRSCTRGEMIMFLWRYAGKPAAKALSKSPFKDVPKTHAFYNAIIWASQKGITKGYPDGTFGINRNVSRGECMMFLWRLRGKPAPKAVSVSPFKDVPKTHAFYNAILWGAQKKITNGYTSGPKKGTFGINENCTRGAIVTFLYRAR